MTINTKMRLSIFASAFALVVAAPVAIAQGSGTWYGDTHTDPIQAEGIITTHSRALMGMKIVPSKAAGTQDSGTWYGNTHTDPVQAEGIITTHSRALMEMKVVPNGAAGNQAEKSVQLNDGSTLHVFADGKMAMQNQYGRVAYMEPGHVMQTKDGKKIVMDGNEVARLDSLFVKNSVGG